MDFMQNYDPMLEGQFVMQNQNNMMMQNQMFTQQNMMGGYSYDRYGTPRVTHKVALDMLRNYVMQQTGCYIQKEKKIEEAPQDIRHACVTVGVTKLPIQYYCIPEVGLQIPYYFCTFCGTLYIYKDFM